MKNYLAIDPGASGGWVFKMGEDACTSGDITELVDLHFPLNTVVVLENVPPFVGRVIPSSAAFKLGKSCGWLEGYFTGKGFAVVLVRPQDWQKTMGVGTKGDSTTSEWKNKLKARAAELFPTVDVTLWNADALLIFDSATRGVIN